MGRKDSSIYFAQKAYLNAERIDYPPGILEASKQLADLYEARGIPDSTIRYLKLTAALNDSLFSRQKTREAESFVFNDLLHKQELEAQRLLDRNKIKMFGLLSIVGIFLLLAFFLWRNNRHKQKSNFLLREKNTQIQSALNDLKSTQAQLIQSEKMASLGELTAGIAHEIQNPLNFVNNFSEVNKELIQEMKQEYGKGNIERANKIGADISGNEEKIIQHGKRADAIVKSMLQHSMSSAGQKESTDINALTAEYMRLAYRGFRAKDNTINISTKTQFDPSLGNINIVPQDIGRVILNLLNNAFYAVTEKKKNGPNGYEPLVTISTKKNNGLAEITIRDNGNGISQKTMDKIFQPFFTTKPAGQGTGLGLSISYDIIKALGGEIKLETKEGEFAEFVIQLPITVSV
jgi:signal transduction histidine kinase